MTQTITMLAVITLCICSLTALLALGLITGLYFFTLKFRNKKPPLIDPKVNSHTPAPDDAQAVRAKFEKEFEAFQEMMGYNADVAYGITPIGEKEG